MQSFQMPPRHVTSMVPERQWTPVHMVSVSVWTPLSYYVTISQLLYIYCITGMKQKFRYTTNQTISQTYDSIV